MKLWVASNDWISCRKQHDSKWIPFSIWTVWVLSAWNGVRYFVSRRNRFWSLMQAMLWLFWLQPLLGFVKFFTSGSDQLRSKELNLNTMLTFSSLGNCCKSYKSSLTMLARVFLVFEDSLLWVDLREESRKCNSLTYILCRLLASALRKESLLLSLTNLTILKISEASRL